MDATHSTTVYDFLLISIMIVDEYYEGIPVGFCIANREDCTVLKILRAVKMRVGSLHPNVFISDIAEQYYKAWIF